MNLSLPALRLQTRHEGAIRAVRPDHVQLRSLLALLAVYAAALVAVIVLPDGADVGCILGGIAGHMFYAAAKLALQWRDASSLAYARLRLRRRMA